MGLRQNSQNSGPNAGNASQFDGNVEMSALRGTGGGAFTGGSSPYSGTVIVQWIWNFTAGTWQLYFDNVLVKSGTTHQRSPPRLRFLTNGGGNRDFDGKFGEAIYTENLTNRADYYTYLSGKWTLMANLFNWRFPPE